MSRTFDDAVALDAAFHMHTYGRKPVLFTRGDGMRLYDDSGKEYLDFLAGIGTINVGHSHPAVVAAICEQVVKLTHVTNLYYVEHRAELASDLVRLFGGDAKVFMCNSGAEASEGAIKLARKWATTHKPTQARGVVTAWRSFHGRTLAALAATGQPGKQESFKPLPGGFTHIALNDVDALDLALDETVCALMLEPVQGEGGVYPCDPEYLAAARALCDEREILLIFDEVQCGLYRTGVAFAHQAYGVKPDIMTLAKALANGLPAGAIVAVDAVAESFEPGDHGSTFAGGPVVCAAARATLAALESEHLGANAAAMGAYLQDCLNDLAAQGRAITSVRGAGLMVAADLADPIAADIVAAALESGIVLNNTGANTMRFLPPLVCTKSEIDTLLDFLHTQIMGGAA